MRKRVTCTLDCFDLCQFEVEVSQGQVRSVRGDRSHPLTQGFICEKGRHHLERHASPDRIKTPLLKTAQGWESIDYETAETRIIDALRSLEPHQILHYTDSGYGGLSKKVDDLFFSCLGGVVRSRGSLCWAAGIAATESNFSAVLSSPPEEVDQARTLVLWGRNPADTNIHLAARIAREKALGKSVVLIDPLPTASVSLSTTHLAIRANTDSFLALGILRLLRDQGRLNQARIREMSEGWDDLQLDDPRLALEPVSKMTGLDPDSIIRLAEEYAQGRVTTYIGYGLQRYRSGGHVVQSINALCFATFNFGGGGSGVNYAHKGFSKRIQPLHKQLNRTHDTFVQARFGEYVLNHDIQMLFVTKANPLVQLPNLNRVKAAFDAIPFKVGIDLFMTDSMQACDLVLPATSLFEEEDVVISSMFSPYLQYTERAVVNDAIKGEYALFQSLARRLGLEEFPDMSQSEYLRNAVEPALESIGTSFEQLREKGWIREPIRPQYETIRRFRFDPRLIAPSEDPGYPLRLLTPHRKESLHSQGFRTVEGLPEVGMSREVYEKWVRSEQVEVRSRHGVLLGRAVILPISSEVIRIDEGYWHHSGAVNVLTTDDFSDIGEQAAYNDTFVKVRGIHESKI